MSEFLKRESHLRKVNEELNKMPQHNTIRSTAPDSQKFDPKHNINNTRCTLPSHNGHNQNHNASSSSPVKCANNASRRPTVQSNTLDSKKKRAESSEKPKSKIFNKTISTVPARGDKKVCSHDSKPPEKYYNRSVLSASKDYDALFKGTPYSCYVVEEKYVNPQFLESPSLLDLVKNGTVSCEENNLSTKSPQKNPTQTTLNGSITSTTISVGTCTDLTLENLASMPSVKLSNGQRISNEGILQFLKSKVSILQEELETHTQDIKKKNHDLAKAYERQKKLETQRDLVYARNTSLTETLSKIETKVESIERGHKDRENELNTTYKQLETLKRDHKILKQANNNLETRLERTNQQLEAANECITQLKASEKDTRENARSEKASKDKELKILRKRNSDLFSAYRKQLFLIDNLKQQIFCHEGAKASGFNEKEFGKLLKTTELH